MPIVSVCVCLSLSLSLSTLLLCNLFGPLLLGPFTPTKDMEEETTVYADEQFKKKKKKKRWELGQERHHQSMGRARKPTQEGENEWKQGPVSVSMYVCVRGRKEQCECR